MKSKSLVRLSNLIGSISILLLVYWVFIFISITVFGFKVFKENLTQTFYLSVVGILALMIGALIINVMFNLTRIAEKHNLDEIQDMKPASKMLGIIFGISFPLVFAFLYVGDYLTSSKKEKMLISSAKSIIESNKEKSDKLLNYSFDKKWIRETNDILDLYSKTDKHFPHVSVIVPDSIDKSQVFLSFEDYYGELEDTAQPSKMNFLLKTTKEEREYLSQVFYHNEDGVRFSANDGRYELYYPYAKNGKRIVLFFSDYQRYGKIGS